MEKVKVSSFASVFRCALSIHLGIGSSECLELQSIEKLRALRLQLLAAGDDEGKKKVLASVSWHLSVLCRLAERKWRHSTRKQCVAGLFALEAVVLMGWEGENKERCGEEDLALHILRVRCICLLRRALLKCLEFGMKGSASAIGGTGGKAIHQLLAVVNRNLSETEEEANATRRWEREIWNVTSVSNDKKLKVLLYLPNGVLPGCHLLLHC